MPGVLKSKFISKFDNKSYTVMTKNICEKEEDENEWPTLTKEPDLITNIPEKKKKHLTSLSYPEIGFYLRNLSLAFEFLQKSKLLMKRSKNPDSFEYTGEEMAEMGYSRVTHRSPTPYPRTTIKKSGSKKLRKIMNPLLKLMISDGPTPRVACRTGTDDGRHHLLE